MLKSRNIFGARGIAVPVMPCPGRPAHAPRAAAEPDEPTSFDLLYRFGEAMERWGRAGFKTVSRDDYESRAAICAGCEHWRPRARLGLGKCAAPGCGCTKLKRWLATEKCPVGKWP